MRSCCPGWYIDRSDRCRNSRLHPFWGYFIQRYGRMVAIACGLFLSGVGFVSMAFVVNPYDWGIYIPAFFMAVGQAGTLIAPQVPDH